MQIGYTNHFAFAGRRASLGKDGDAHSACWSHIARLDLRVSILQEDARKCKTQTGMETERESSQVHKRSETIIDSVCAPIECGFGSCWRLDGLPNSEIDFGKEMHI